MNFKNMKGYVKSQLLSCRHSGKGKNILKYSPKDKSLKAPFIIYADLEVLLKKEQC